MASGEPARGGVFVLGMHSSGTSALTRVVDLLGVPVAQRRLLEPDATNPAGYWEPSTLVKFNDRLLHSMGGSWIAPPPLGVLAGADRGMRALATEARAAFAAVHLGPRWVWKDPRNCLTLSFWRAALGDPAAVVVAFREPQEVVASFGRRKVVSPDAALALWERHLRAAVLLSEGLPSLVVDYALLVADPDATVRCIGGFLAAQGLTDTPVDPGAAARSVVPELHRVRGASDAPRLSVEQRRLADALRDAAARGAGTETLELGVETPSTEYLLTEERRRLQARTAG